MDPFAAALPHDLMRPADFLARRAAEKDQRLKLNTPPAASESTAVRAETSDEADADIEDTIFGARVVDQEALERSIAVQADKAINEKEDELDKRRLKKTTAEKEKLEYQLSRLGEKLRGSRTPDSDKDGLREQIGELKKLIVGFDQDLRDIKGRIHYRKVNSVANPVFSQLSATPQQLPNETRQQFLVRTGKITPFAQIPELEESGLSFEGDANIDTTETVPSSSALGVLGMSHQNLRKPGFQAADDSDSDEQALKPTKKLRRLRKNSDSEIAEESDEQGDESDEGSGHRKRKAPSDDEYDPETLILARRRRLTPPNDHQDDDLLVTVKDKAGVSKKELVELDDGNERSYQARLRKWKTARSKARSQQNPGSEEFTPVIEEQYMPHPTEPDTCLGEDLKIPGDVYQALFDYQKSGVKWLYELHRQNVGGILGDEMGLGKTIQVIAFLAALHYNEKLHKPILVVAPATVLKQWVSEFHRWWPPMRVSILHSSGSGMIGNDDEDELEELIEGNSRSTQSQIGAKKVFRKVFAKGHVLVTTYAGLKSYRGLLLDADWEYAVLDEGHKIRNQESEAALLAKQLKTRHRIILSGTPIQNNLTELWSLFDFVYPGRLGVLPVFQSQFADPIKRGGYSNATNMQVQTAQQCALVLRELIAPYLLRRLKVDVAVDLPKKSERVLFCKLTKYQRDAYTKFLTSKEAQAIKDGKRDSLPGIDTMRKICNHPDLLNRDILTKTPGYDYGKGGYSGKMQVTKKLLELWKEKGHRALVFAQTRQMLDILEKYIRSFDGFNYRRMDGNTAIKDRQKLVDDFNNDATIDVFLLTTRVGGLGLNLVSADRIIIFDPDWNPSTDMQARERAWRLGQKKEVTIYRLLTAGTIEEKIYHRQIFKQHLTANVLTETRQGRYFQMEDMHDLFKLGGSSVLGTETGRMFQGSEKVFSNGESSTDGSNVVDETSVVRTLDGVAGEEQYTNAQDLKDEENKGKSDEARFLDEIFGGTGVLSALEHDSVMKVSQLNPTLAEREAAKVASKAAKRLLESIAATQKAEIGTVTWTGKSGTAGREEADDSYGLPKPSGGLLNKLKRTRENTSLPDGKRARVGPVQNQPHLASGTSDLITRLHTFLRGKGGKVGSQDIAMFASDVVDGGDVQQKMQFREMLKELCVLNKEDRMWTLRREYL